MRPWRGGRAGEVGDFLVAEAGEMPGGVVAGDEFLDFNGGKGLAERRGRSQQDGRDFPRDNLLINPRLGLKAIDGRDEQAVHPAREHPAQAGILAFRLVQGVGEEQIVAEFVGAFLNGINNSRVNRVGRRRDDEAEELGRLRAQSLGAGVGHIAQVERELFDLGLGDGGDVRFVAQGFGDGHHGDADELGNVF